MMKLADPKTGPTKVKLSLKKKAPVLSISLPKSPSRAKAILFESDTKKYIKVSDSSSIKKPRLNSAVKPQPKKATSPKSMPASPAKAKPVALKIKIKASNIDFAKTLNGAMMGKMLGTSKQVNKSKINVKIPISVKNLAST